MNRIAVIGSLNVDYVTYVENVPALGETVLADRFEIIPGGKGANQAFALGRMGASVSMFGAVGKDSNALIELNNLKLAGVDVSNVAQYEAPTGLAFITVGSSGDNNIVVAQGANKLVSRDYIDSCLAEILKNDIVIFQLEIPLDTVIYAAQIMKSSGKTVILDPAPAPGPLPVELLINTDIIKPNESELKKLTGISIESNLSNLQTACQTLNDLGVGCVLASLGPQGVFVKKTQQKGNLYGVEDVKVIDTTAAGDSFTAAVGYALANNRSIEEAVIFANLISTEVVQREGAQKSIPTHAEIIEVWDFVFPKEATM